MNVGGKMKVQKGLSPKYAAPEIFADCRLTGSPLSVADYMKGDVFAFGVILWELVTRKVPWQGVSIDDIESLIRFGNRNKLKN